MTVATPIRDKRSRETKLYTVSVYDDMPRGTEIDAVLDVIVDPLSDDELDAIGSNEVPLAVDAAGDWTINEEELTDRSGAVFPAGSCMQGNIAGGNDGYTDTIRILYSRNDDPGPHEATVLLRLKDQPS